MSTPSKEAFQTLTRKILPNAKPREGRETQKTKTITGAQTPKAAKKNRITVVQAVAGSKISLGR